MNKSSCNNNNNNNNNNQFRLTFRQIQKGYPVSSRSL